jgi:nucleoid DNA-binding protein
VEGGREHAGGSILARAAPHERLIEQVSVETGIAFDRVKEVTEAFLAIVLERLAHDGAVTLNKIGRLWVSTRRDTRKNMERPGSPNLESLTHEGVQHRVVFRKSSALRQALNETRPKEIQMDKLKEFVHVTVKR